MKKLIIVLSVFLAVNSASYAQANPKSSKEETQKTNYVCPMHPEEMSSTKGKCSKCGMELSKTKKLKHNAAVKGNQTSVSTEAKYVCPMHPKAIGKKGDKCPKCGMNLMVKEKDKSEKN
jgi:DNA-directed RNA polymerase subunit RPC12/RpoP